MPHLKLEYSANLEAHCDVQQLCTALCNVLTQIEDGQGARVFPLLGTRVLAYPAAHAAVADGAPERAFLYMQLLVTAGRSDRLLARVGAALLAAVDGQCAALQGRLALRVTLHIDEGAPAYEGKRAYQA